MSELKPCPFCGSSAIDVHVIDNPMHFIKIAYCKNCDGRNRISDWNTRPIEDKLRKELDDLLEQFGYQTEEVRKLEQRLFKARFVIRAQMSWKKEVRKQLEAAKQWQREACKFLRDFDYPDKFITTYVPDEDKAKIKALIKQAEEELTCDKTFTKNNLKKESK